jgi:hypothetical protein
MLAARRAAVETNALDAHDLAQLLRRIFGAVLKDEPCDGIAGVVLAVRHDADDVRPLGRERQPLAERDERVRAARAWRSPRPQPERDAQRPLCS